MVWNLVKGLSICHQERKEEQVEEDEEEEVWKLWEVSLTCHQERVSDTWLSASGGGGANYQPMHHVTSKLPVLCLLFEISQTLFYQVLENFNPMHAF